jgi:hypothetical protein
MSFLVHQIASGWDSATHDRHGSTAVHWAAGSGHVHIVKVLVHTSNQFNQPRLHFDNVGAFVLPVELSVFD